MSITSFFAQTTPYYNDPSYYNTYNTYTTSGTSAEAAAFTGLMLMFMLLFAVGTYVITAIFLSRIFKKAGIEGWKAWVPVYNTWTLLEMGGQKGFWAVLALVPFVNIVAVIFMYIAMYHIGLKFGKEGAFVLLAIFLPLVWMIWLAVDKSTWKGTPGPAIKQTANKSPEAPVQEEEDTTPPAK